MTSGNQGGNSGGEIGQIKIVYRKSLRARKGNRMTEGKHRWSRPYSIKEQQIQNKKNKRQFFSAVVIRTISNKSYDKFQKNLDTDLVLRC